MGKFADKNLDRFDQARPQAKSGHKHGSGQTERKQGQEQAHLPPGDIAKGQSKQPGQPFQASQQTASGQRADPLSTQSLADGHVGSATYRPQGGQRRNQQGSGQLDQERLPRQPEGRDIVVQLPGQIT